MRSVQLFLLVSSGETMQDYATPCQVTGSATKWSAGSLVWLARPSHLPARDAKGKGRSSGSND